LALQDNRAYFKLRLTPNESRRSYLSCFKVRVFDIVPGKIEFLFFNTIDVLIILMLFFLLFGLPLKFLTLRRKAYIEISSDLFDLSFESGYLLVCLL
jgi:hypothetical protein